MSSQLPGLFARLSPSYDRVNRILSLGLDSRWRARLISEIEPRPGIRMLDLCAGTLACTLEALRRFPYAGILAADFCRPMLDLGLSRFSESQRGRVEILCSDALQLDLPPASLDVVICAWGMRHIPDQQAMMERIGRWLAPAGQFITCDFFRPATAISRLFHATAGRHLLPAAGEICGGFGSAYRYLYESIENYASREEYERLLAAQGFSVKSSVELTFGIVSLVNAVSM